ncbi:MAG: tetratricopeptide repeat protein [Pyrinomonadaceae bacterium]
MWKVILILAVFFSLLGNSCESRVFVQNAETPSVVVSPTPSPLSNGFAKPLPPEQAMYLREGLKHKAAGEYPEAIEQFKKSIAAGNDDKEMFRRIAELYLAQKRYVDAETYLREIIEKDAKDAMAHWALAKILVENLGKFEEGLKEAITSKELYGDYDVSYVHDRVIGEAYDGLGDYENAIKHYRIFLRGASYAPESDDYKEIKKRVSELEKLVKPKK